MHTVQRQRHVGYRQMVGRAFVALVMLFTTSTWGVGRAAADAATDDYFVAAFGDPMDFSNPEDLVIDTGEAMFVGGYNKSISGGQLHFDTRGPFQFDPVWPGYATGIPHGREGGRVPIDTARFTRLAIRMNAPDGAPVGIRWFSCMEANASCQGGQAFTARSGWNTYDLKLGDDGTVPGLPVNWTGRIVGLRIVGTVSGHFDIDYLRLTSPTGDTTELPGGPSIDLRPTDRLDFATTAGNPWDMDSLADIAQQVGLKPGGNVQGNQFRGCSLGTSTGQFPGIMLNMPGGRTIDADRFKTLTFEYSYDGSFSTRPVPGGGAFARVFWFDPAGNRHPTQAIHLYPNERVVQIRLDDPASTYKGIEPGKGVATGKAWAGRVSQFRISPNDTKDSRCFTIGRVWLTSDDPVGTAIDLPVGSPTASLSPITVKSSVATSVVRRPSVRHTTRRTTKKRR
jgi:hypothetical protein